MAGKGLSQVECYFPKAPVDPTIHSRNQPVIPPSFGETVPSTLSMVKIETNLTVIRMPHVPRILKLSKLSYVDGQSRDLLFRMSKWLLERSSGWYLRVAIGPCH